MINHLLYLYTESPLHAGAAASDGVVDLPIQREVATGYPLVWGQSLKGALRQAARDRGMEEEFGADVVNEVFGPPPPRPNAEDHERGVNPHAGLLRVGDAQLVALPVSTMQRTFAWASSALALSRLARKYQIADLSADLPDIPAPAHGRGYAADPVWVGAEHEEQIVGPCVVNLAAHTLAPANSAEPAEGDQAGTGRAQDPTAVVISDEDPVRRWGDLLSRHALGERVALGPFATKLTQDLFVVGEDVMQLLVRQGTEYTIRTQLDPGTKTVNQLFSSEYLPAETILAAVLTLRPHPDNGDYHQFLLQELLGESVVQIGGDETIGKGLTWTRLVGDDR
ncbi:type III-B CRISPR module RAMP protein Cmr4 [Nocardiopsis dassonvillei]|uniref:type III-B CRISPR module RAMP protein Cmr4 n=1 Tax=Nocardiopsis dassonvillei TaxID=2014 RepID=UPI00200BCF9C|nr:type III-B CRISPR module RAMP protein Cmr4 [Nocardiopsis dassonvillei]MCK9874107.1 type III-B CRISPR module RAMP protein Cmr4 [Nocardiopsis dassonvillei]